MLFNSIEFLIFFPLVVLLYFVLPKKCRYIWLLVSSYYFYMCWNAKYAILLFTSTFVTYLSGILLQKVKESEKREDRDLSGKKKLIVAASFVLNLAILFYYKYIGFAFDVLSSFFELINIRLNAPKFDILLPVGISFYTFQALSYTMDVYRDEVYAEKNLLRYALFVSFFPQLVAGPIERSKNLLKQLAVPKKFDFESAREGLLRMLWGFFLKRVLADRIAIFVDQVYDNTEIYSGAYLVVATVLFAVQIYCDFAGYSTIAVGAAQIMGIQLMENFDAPYFSYSVAEFWRKWHISLTSWFKDYLYIPLGGSRKGKLRKYINKLIVFLVSGLWHGAALHYVIWGGINGIYQVVGEAVQPLRDRLALWLHVKKDSFGNKLARMLGTFILIDVSWIFFRADTAKKAVDIIRSVFTVHNLWVLFDGSLYKCGLDQKSFWVMIFGIIILSAADFLKHRNILVRNVILEQGMLFRSVFFALAIMLILILGIYGPTYEKANFIYFQF